MLETGAKPIPTMRRQIINHPNELPDKYSSTPGGTLYSTTPGGTRIIYERNFLMNLRESPLARTPPGQMAYIPGVTNIEPTDANSHHNFNKIMQQRNKGKGYSEIKNSKMNRNRNDISAMQPQFDMEI